MSGSSAQRAGFGLDHRRIGIGHHSAQPRPDVPPLTCPQYQSDKCTGKLPYEVCESTEPWNDVQEKPDLIDVIRGGDPLRPILQDLVAQQRSQMM